MTGAVPQQDLGHFHDPDDLTEPTLAVIVVAAGNGARLGHADPKALVEARGRSLLERCLEQVFSSDRPAQVIVVAPPARVDDARTIAERAAGPAVGHVSVVAGGATRQASVAAGLAGLADGIRTVLVHDAARALTPERLIDRVVARVERTGHGVVPALPVSDTLKRVDAGNVVETVDRSQLVHVQTPQGFPREHLVTAYAAADREYTDDAAVFTAAGFEVETVTGEPRAFKITTPWDLRRAELILDRESGSAAAVRTGVGLDVHAFDEERPLWLGGLYWPDEPGLAGHSDGDAVCHAICDALLSAAGLGDMGSRFGTSDPRFEGAHGEVFVAETVALVSAAGFSVGNVSVQVVAKHPRIGERRMELEQHLSQLVGAPVSVAGTTSDGLGFTGRAEGVAVICTALVQSSQVGPAAR